jgi:hypothetical protein
MPINCIGYIREFQVHIIVPGKQPGQVCFKASVSTPKPLMNVSVLPLGIKFPFI